KPPQWSAEYRASKPNGDEDTPPTFSSPRPCNARAGVRRVSSVPLPDREQEHTFVYTLLAADRTTADLLQADLGTQSRGEAVERLEQMPARASKSKPAVVVLGRDSLLWLPRWRHVGLSAPVMVVLPPGSTGRERAHCLDAGADECLSRPLNADELRARLSVLWR